LVLAVVPAAERLDEAAWTEVAGIIEAALAQRPPEVRRQIDIFLGLMSALTLVRYRRPLRDLPADKARSFFRRLERSRLTLIRRGFWGVRTLALMGYYGRAQARAAVGYRASGGGWRARGGKQDPWDGRGHAGAPEDDVLTVDAGEGPDA
jgi:hypothetical protein